jgi:hypothetical protein
MVARTRCNVNVIPALPVLFCVTYTKEFPLGVPDSPVIRTTHPHIYSALTRDYSVSNRQQNRMRKSECMIISCGVWYDIYGDESTTVIECDIFLNVTKELTALLIFFCPEDGESLFIRNINNHLPGCNLYIKKVTIYETTSSVINVEGLGLKWSRPISRCLLFTPQEGEGNHVNWRSLQPVTQWTLRGTS